LSEADKNKLVAKIQEYAKEGLRVLGIGIIYGAGILADLNENNASEKIEEPDKYGKYEVGCTFLGIVCIKDPVREEVK
jgi:magnesium-transporting ATPase (P-type)